MNWSAGLRPGVLKTIGAPMPSGCSTLLSTRFPALLHFMILEMFALDEVEQ